MSAAKLLSMIGAAAISLLLLVACGSLNANKVGSQVPPQATGAPEPAVVVTSERPTAEGLHGTATTVTVSSKEITTSVNITSITEVPSQPAGQTSPPNAASDGLGTPPMSEQSGQVQPGPAISYADSTYGFNVSYPDNFLFRSRAPEQLANLNPKPVASFTIMNPKTAKSDLGDMEPADLEIRIYAPEQQATLEAWLRANGVLTADTVMPLDPFHATNATGVRLCSSTMLVPPCTYFFIGNGWIYQLIAFTIDGETMMRTFALQP